MIEVRLSAEGEAHTAVHVSCAQGALHVLLYHVAVPLVAAAVLSLPLARLVKAAPRRV